MADRKNRPEDESFSSKPDASPPDKSENSQKTTGEKPRQKPRGQSGESAPADSRGGQSAGKTADFPVVGIGASAGGVHALQEFFEHVPADTGIAFVVILHLSSKYESSLPELLAKHTAMRVQSAEEAMALAPNQVFIIPANQTLTLRGRKLSLSERDQSPGKFKPIDRFFESLAEQVGGKAVGVILSGTGTDGTLGIRAVKSAGGITFAQREESAEFVEMPRHAIESGQVDMVLDAAEIARELGDLVHHPYLKRNLHELEESALSGWERIQNLLKKTGIDFSQYKQSTVHRRIARRMALKKMKEMDEYAAYLKDHGEEVKALREDLLIKVTQFFRDAETFDALAKHVLPQIVANKHGDDPIRIWVPGCASGEEVYSLAMALAEFLDEKHAFLSAQIFGTDVSEEAIEKARRGFYPAGLVSELSDERLRKFFIPSDGGYQVKKHLREMCVFARQDFISDPPFSRLDLISCRNVLIYFSSALQKKVFPLFHYALNPEGFLVLGASENIGQASELFAPVDKKNRIFVRKKSRQQASGYWPGSQGERYQPRKEQLRPGSQHNKNEHQSLHREVDRFLLRKLDPAAVLVDSDFNVVEFRGNTAPFLEHHPGKASLNLLKMTRDMLRLDLRTMLQRAKQQQTPQQKRHLLVDSDQEQAFSLEVSPLQYGQESYFLVEFTSSPGAPETAETSVFVREKTDSALKQENRRLIKDLQTSREYAQQAIEEKDEALEDLKAANEEILSSNEELQSINEEIETAKEELQSSNEELTTVNQELQHRNLELAEAHNDLSNLILSVQIPFVIINKDLKIRRVSPNAEEMLQINPADVGRALTELKLSFELPSLENTLREVIDKGRDLEQEVLDRRGCWNLLRIRPYLSNEKSDIQGAVLALFDIDRIKRSLEETEKAYKYSLQIVDTIKDPLLVLDEELKVKKANPAFYQKFKVSPNETEGFKVFDLGAGQWNLPELRRLLAEILPQSSQMDNYQVEFDFPNLGPRTMMLSARKMKTSASPREAILLGIQDVTEQKQVEIYLRTARQSAEEASRAKSEFIANISHEIRTPMTVIRSALDFLAETDPGPDQQEYIDMAEKSSIDLLELLDDMLDFSKIEADKIEILSLPFDLRENVAEVVNILRNEAVRKGLKLKLRIMQDVPDTVLGDRKRLRQVLVNLIGNAIKFTEAGEVDILVEVLQEPARLLFSIRDTGIGISNEDMDRLFQSFTQVDSSATREYGGAGLGLSICRGLVDRMGGTIWVKSRKEKGSTFYFTVPLREAASAGEWPPLAEDAGKVASSPESLPEAKVLVGEDDMYIRTLATMMLADWGLEVVHAENGAEVLEKYREESPNLIFMDLQMPKMGGLEAARHIRELERESGGHVPIIAFTAHAQITEKERCLEAGMDDVLTKPFAVQEMFGVLRRFLISQDPSA